MCGVEVIDFSEKDPFVIVDNDSRWNEDPETGESECQIYLRDCDLMQFTGLLDKNGVEIYEGDIIASHPRFENIPTHGRYDTAEVVEMRQIDGSDDMGIDCIGYPLYWTDKEVIGNIYENSELLEVK